ncbi:MAG TPA: MCE family protein [Aeromicrobium sp.]|nr:MCE family protein [Aeromicrobium sp.]
MKRFTRDDPFRIGIAAFVALGVLGALILLISVIPFGASTYHAQLSHTAGLRVKEGVQVAGVEVGEVKSVKVVGRHVDVAFTVDNDVRMGAQTTAAVKVGTLLGTHYLAVEPHGTGTLPDKTIPLSRTAVPFNLQDVIDEGTKAVEELDGAKIAESLSVVGDTLKAAGPSLGPAFKGISRISEVITQRDAQIGELLEASRSISTQLEESTDDLTDLMRQSNLVIEELIKRREAIRDLLSDVSSITANLEGILDENADKLGPMLKDLDAITAVLNARDDQLRTALHNLAVGSRYFANATGDGPFINLYFTDAIPNKLRCGLPGSCD